jgi:beta-glucosidase
MHDDGEFPRFPATFQWGVATSAFQIEGATEEDGRGPSIWDAFCRVPDAIAGGEDGRIACDHYHRYRDDVALLQRLGVDAYRFSIAWTRIQPEGRGLANPKGLDFYRRLLDELQGRGIRPLPTLFHWDLPLALQQRGGWSNRDTAARFAEFADLLAVQFGDRIGDWITFNETFEHTVLGHALGVHAPGERCGLGMFPVWHHQLLAHGMAMQALRARLPAGTRIGIAQSMARARPASRRLGDHLAAWLLEHLHLRGHTDPLLLGRYPRGLRLFGIDTSAIMPGDLQLIAQPLDFLGINFYNAQYVRRATGEVPIEAADPPAGLERTEMGWPVTPDGFTELLLYLRKRYGRRLPPLVITENGAAFADAPTPTGEVADPRRIAYLRTHLQALHRAIEAGVDVRGYFVWSLLDNFEWAEGYRPRFGLVHVDYPSQRRTPKASFEWYRRCIAAQR